MANEIDPRHIALVIGTDEPSVFKDYVDTVANEGLVDYKNILQWGGKAGESLYAHVLNGVFVLEQLRPALALTDLETRVLFTTFTVHDLNKVLDIEGSYNEIVTLKSLATEIERLGLGRFFPEYADYLEDILALARAHSAHYHHDGDGLLASYDPYGLSRERVDAFKHLVRAADVVALSHTLEERRHKQSFLFHLNAFSEVQYEFCTHSLTEDRGLLSNVVHGSIVTHLRDELGLIPLLFYPDGVAYLKPKGRELTLSQGDLERIGKHAAGAISEMTRQQLPDFVESKPGGIKIMPKCLNLGVPFEEIWRFVVSKAHSRAGNLDPESIAEKASRRAERDLEKNATAFPDAADAVKALLEGDAPLTAQTEAGLRQAELVRAYYIFFKEYFAKDIGVDEPWHYIYQLLELPKCRWPIYEFFSPLWDRAYVVVRDVALTEEELHRRFVGDGSRLLTEQGRDDPKVALFTEYVQRYAVFSFQQQQSPTFAGHLAHYVENQHKQCVMCSSPFPTDKWMSGDVRDDVTVQAFSNRLRGGPGDPKKNVCALCRLQFLVEKLNYPPVRGETIVYLHLFPYAFLTAPFIQGLWTRIQRLTRENLVERALFLHSADAIETWRSQGALQLDFTAITKSGKPQPYGLYLPRYSTTVGNRIIFPLNPAGRNDTERFLFALWNGMLLQKHFGCKVLLSDSPVAPLDKEDFHDLYVANAPLACRGLVQKNDYAAYRDGSSKPGTLAVLWDQVEHLFALSRLTRSAETRRNEQVTLVQAMGGTPLDVFYTAEKLLEARASNREWHLIRLSQQAFPHVSALSRSIGGEAMAELSKALERLAQIAWEGRLRGRSLRKNSLMAPLDEIFKKLGHHSEAADIEVLRAATVEDIFEHLERIADKQYRPGQRKWEATEAFVNGFFNNIYGGVYGGKLRKLLADEKLIRSAYMFYIREQIPGKKVDEEVEA